MQGSAEKRALINQIDFLCTNYESIYTECDCNRLLEYFSANVLQIWMA